MPSSLPTVPIPSKVVQVIPTRSGVTPQSEARFSVIAFTNGDNFGFCAIITALTFTILYPFSSSISFTLSNNITLETPLYFSSVSGKCFPISPSDAEDKSASETA